MYKSILLISIGVSDWESYLTELLNVFEDFKEILKLKCVIKVVIFLIRLAQCSNF